MDSLEKARNIRLYHCDCLVGMSRIETGSVDLVLCDRPMGQQIARGIR